MQHRVLALLLAVTVAACSGSPPPPRNLPPPVQSTALGPGDVLEITVVGEKELPHEFKIAADGTLDFPYVKQLAAAGLEPQELADHLKKKLVDGNSYTKAERATAAMIRKLGNLTGAGARELDHQIRSAGQTRSNEIAKK